MANLITAARVILIPFIVYTLFLSGSAAPLVAAGLFLIAAFSDWLDGFVARRFEKVTFFGSMADPLADRLFIISIAIALFIKHEPLFPFWILLLIIARDTVLLIGFQYFRKRGKIMHVSLLGKSATALVFVSFFLFILTSAYGDVAVAALTTLYVALAVYMVAAVDYYARAQIADR